MELAQLIVSGLAMGSIYGLFALGFVLVYRAVGVINFAQGELVTLAAFLGVTAAVTLQIPLLLAYVVVLAAMGLFGYVFERVAYHPLRGKPLLTVIISTIGISIILRNGARIVWGPYPLALPSFFSWKSVEIGGVLISPQMIFVVVVAGALFVLLQLFLNRTLLGRMMQAVAQDREAARLMGIHVDRIIALTFVLNAILAGIAGLLLAPIFLVTTDMGSSILVKAFSATIIGGFGSVPGAIVGGLILGVVEGLAAVYVSSIFKDGVAFLALILVLLIAPGGLFAEKVSERV